MSQRKKWLLGLGAIFLLAGFVFLIYWVFIGRFYETTDDAYVNGNLVQIMPQVTGHVTAILAEETDLVAKGEPLVILDRADTEVALKQAESQLATTVREVNQLYQNVEQLKANVKLQQDTLIKAEDDYKRRLGLQLNQFISREDLQHAKISVDTTTDALKLSQSQLAAAIALVQNSDLYHHPDVLRAIANLRNAYLAYERTTIYSPETGYVAKRPVLIGQQVTPNTILMIIVPLDQVWVDANFKESQLQNIRIGQSVRLISDVYSNDVKYEGTVVGLSAGTGSAFDLLPPQNATGNWIKIVQRLPVRIAINKDQLAKYPLQIGLSMTVTINTHKRNGPILTRVPQNKVVYQSQNYGSDFKQADQLINQILRANADNRSYPGAH